MNHKNNSIRFICSILLIALAGFLSPAIGQQLSQTYTLNELSKIDNAVIQGRNPSYTFYVPTPADWQVGGINLDLKIHASSILLPSSTLTLMVDNTPIDSTHINKDGQDFFSWQISIPKSLLDDELTTLTLVGYQSVGNDRCQDIRNDGNWVSISGQSTITYQYELKDKTHKLADFPFPFIQKQSPEPDKIALLLPKKLGADSFIPYLQIANILSKQANWRGLSFVLINKTTPLSSIIADIQNNAILIAEPSELNLSDIQLPGSFAIKNQLWYQNNGEKIDEKRGLIFLIKNPANPNLSILVISANSHVGIESALKALNRNTVKYLADHDQYYLTPNLENNDYQKKHKRSISFKELGYEDQVVQGDGQQTLNFDFIIPSKFKNGQVILDLLYSFSPFVDKENPSYMMIKLNGLPLDGVKLKPGDARQRLLEVKLPREQVKPGKNNLEIVFDLRLPEKYCAKAYTSLAWGTIYRDSYINFTPRQSDPGLSIKNYPYYMDNTVILAIPTQENLYQNSTFLKELLSLASSFKYSQKLGVLKNTQISQTPKNAGLIYITYGENTSSVLDQMKREFNKLSKSLNITSDNTLRAIDGNLLNNAFKKQQEAGFVAITEENLSHPNIFIYGYAPEEMKLALSLLNDSFKLESLSGDIAIAFKNGTYTNLSSHDIHQQIEKEVKLEKISNNVFYTMMVVLGLLVLVGVIWFLIRATKNY